MTYPELRLDRDALDGNIAAMAQWCARHRVELAPHVKTTMCRPIVARQLAAGATAVTVATVEQAATVCEWFSGPDTGAAVEILIANQVVDPVNLGWLRSLAGQRDSRGDGAGRPIRILVDSVAGVDAAAAVFRAGARPLEVLVDVGTAGGRTGVRNIAAAREVAEAVGSAPGLRLVGVSGYEGVVPNVRDGATIAAVDAHCAATRNVFEQLRALMDTAEPIFTMGGSAFPDRVVEHLPDDARALIRSGCYVAHDHGTYAAVSPIPGLAAALRVRAVVVSAPEPGLVVLGAGKRDLSYDAGLPFVIGSPESGTAAALAASDWRVAKLFDHHAVLTAPLPAAAAATGVSIPVGAVVDLGISHPCSVFDRWSEITVTDGGDAELELWKTGFARRDPG